MTEDKMWYMKTFEGWTKIGRQRTYPEMEARHSNLMVILKSGHYLFGFVIVNLES